MAKKNETPPKSYEEAQRELEQILAEIEEGKIGLEESLVKYERGTFLINYCQGILNQAEKQIEQISKAQDGSLRGSPLPEQPA